MFGLFPKVEEVEINNSWEWRDAFYSGPLASNMSNLVEHKSMNTKEIRPQEASSDVPKNYAEHILRTTEPLPPVKWSHLLQEVQWISFSVIFGLPVLGIIGASYVNLRWETFLWSVAYYFLTGLGTFRCMLCRSVLIITYVGITAGYHRLWSHCSYNAPIATQAVLACLGAGAVQGSIKWWARGHRAHHRYTDTELDPYNAHRGFWFTHVGWMLLKPRRKPGAANVSDLENNRVVKWQHQHYIPLFLVMAFLLPTLVAHVGWGDAKGGFVYAGVLRLVVVHHVRQFTCHPNVCAF